MGESVRQHDAGELRTGGEQGLRQPGVAGGRVGSQGTAPFEIAAGDIGVRVVARGEPDLGFRADGKLIRCAWPPSLVLIQPGSTALLRSHGERRATANASSTS